MSGKSKETGQLRIRARRLFVDYAFSVCPGRYTDWARNEAVDWKTIFTYFRSNTEVRQKVKITQVSINR